MHLLRTSILLLLIFAQLSCTRGTQSDVPNLEGKGLNGEVIKLQDWAKNKVTVVNVWATFCGPCLEELPMLHRLYDKYKNNPDFAFLSVALNTESEIQQFINSTDAHNPFRRALAISKLTTFRLPTISVLSKGYIIQELGNGNFQAGLEPGNDELEKWRKALGFEPIPYTVIYNKQGKIAYKTNYQANLESNLERYQDSLQRKIDELLKR